MKVALIDSFFKFYSPKFDDGGVSGSKGELFLTSFPLEFDGDWRSK
jgi:hypothetical protein